MEVVKTHDNIFIYYCKRCRKITTEFSEFGRAIYVLPKSLNIDMYYGKLLDDNTFNKQKKNIKQIIFWMEE